MLMNTRGLMELIVLNIGLDMGVISPTLFAMMVIMALVTTMATTPILHLRARGQPIQSHLNEAPYLTADKNITAENAESAEKYDSGRSLSRSGVSCLSGLGSGFVVAFLTWLPRPYHIPKSMHFSLCIRCLVARLKRSCGVRLRQPTARRIRQPPDRV